MGWSPGALGGPEYVIVSTLGGRRDSEGRPLALGYHTGHWEIGQLVDEAARTFRARGTIPFAAYCSDPCDGRTQGTTGMFDSLPYRNDAAIVMRRLIRSLPTASGVMGIATCDKGLPATMLARPDAVLFPGSSCQAASRFPPWAPKMRDKFRASARDSRTISSVSTTRPKWDVGRAARRAADVSFLERRQRRRWWRKHWAWRFRTPRWRRPASRHGSSWANDRRWH